MLKVTTFVKMKYRIKLKAGFVKECFQKQGFSTRIEASCLRGQQGYIN